MNIAKIDDTDRAILNELLVDSDRTLKDVAESIGVTHGTVHMRLKKLKQSGVIRGTRTIVDWSSVGYSMGAFVGINLHRARDCKLVQNKLHNIPEVVEVYYSTGKYNLLVKILLKDVTELHHFLMSRLQEIKEIQATDTMVILDAPLARDRPI